MGFFSKIFKGIKKVVKGIGKVVKKVVKSKAFKVIAAVALAVVAPQLIPTIMKGITTAGTWAANTIATGASAAWQGIKAAGTAIKTFGGNVFKSVTETISSGVNFMKTKVGFGTPSTIPFDPDAYRVATGVMETGPAVAKKTLGEKILGFGKKFVQEKGTEIIRDKVLEQKEEEQSLLQATPTYETRAVGGYDSSQGFAPLMDLAKNTQSPYLSYSQGQQLFGAPATATTGNI